MNTTTPSTNENATLANPRNSQIADVCLSNDIIIVGKDPIDEISNFISREPLFGIDTIKVGFTVSAKDINFDGWKRQEWVALQEEGNRLISISYLKCFFSPNGTPMTLKYLPYDYQKLPLNLLLIEFSLPRLIFGTNSKNIRDWQFSLDFVNATIKNIPGLPSLGDIRDATLYRLDICANFQVGRDNIGDYLQVLSRCNYPHRKTTAYPGTGVVFSAKEIRTMAYDKYEESGDEGTEGLLRLEIQLKSKREIGKGLKEEYPTLRHISLQRFAKRFLKELSILHLDSPVICDQLEMTQALSEKYKPAKVRSMLGYWVMKRTTTREQMISMGYTTSSISRLEKHFTEAGVSSHSTDSKKTLPALSPFFPEIDKICNKPLSDTRVIDTRGSTETNIVKKREQGEGSAFKPRNGLWVAQMTIHSKHGSKFTMPQSECREWLKENQTQVENRSTLSCAQTSQAVFFSKWLILSENSIQSKTIDWHKPFY